ncbi:hypothetical protein [Hoeflea marina]|nr:hypothetical protein [Hoeflea marina]
MRYAIIFGTLACAASAHAEQLTVAAWNIKASIYEQIERRHDDFVALDHDIAPDVLLLVEVPGLEELERIVSALGWSEYQAVISDLGVVRDQAFQGLEVAVISKIPFAAVTEYDVSPGDGVGQVLGTFGQMKAGEEKLETAGIPSVSKVDGNQRGTLRVELKNGLILYPVHLKSNSNSRCSNISGAISAFKMIGEPVPPNMQAAYDIGFDKATETHRSNALKREAVIAAVKLLADQDIAAGHPVLIGGDFNASFEPGKAGTSFEDCALANFSCERGPFPTNACEPGDGFDDTLAILERGLVGTGRYHFLTRDLKSTYDDDVFYDAAIDHLVVPDTVADRFTKATSGTAFYGSDHKPVVTVFTE